MHGYKNVGILGLNQLALLFLEKEGKRRVWLITIIFVYQRSQGFSLLGSTYFFQG